MANFYLSTLKRNSLNFLLFIGLCLFGLNGFSQQVVEFTNSGNQTWTAPCGVTQVTVEAWGGGGGGGNANTFLGTRGAGGGGGGAYAKKNQITVVPGVTYNLTVGAGGNGSGNGGNSWFKNADTVLARGGIQGGDNNGDGGAGGTAASSIGDIRRSGGNGYDGNSNLGAAGGGGAGTTQNGANATSTLPGTGGLLDGGLGGGIRTNNGGGFDGQNVGGGGGGAKKSTFSASYNGGDGANGKIKITYFGAATYCNVSFTTNVEPITLVNFANLNNTSTASLGGSELEIFCLTANVTLGSSHVITVKGNTGGNYVNYFTAFFDWNQDGDYGDAGERFPIGSITNSTGLDAKTATVAISVPNGATQGVTKMRVVKNYASSPTNPCGNYNYGQAEEYLVDVAGNCKKPDALLANGVSDTLVVCTGTEVTLKQVGGNAGGGEWIYKKVCDGDKEFSTLDPDATVTFTTTGFGITTFYLQAACGTGCAAITIVVRDTARIAQTQGTANTIACQNLPLSINIVYQISGGGNNATLTGPLPNGVTGSYNSVTRQYVISGTPTQSGTFPYTVKVSGNAPCVNIDGTITGTITVNAVPTLEYNKNAALYCTGGPITENIPTISGGSSAISYSVSPALPAGLSIDPTTGIISGTPTTTQASKNYIVTVVTTCGTKTKQISITISSGSFAYNITPGTTNNVCSNFGGIQMGLDGSTVGESYQLYRNGISIGPLVPGSGSALNLSNQTADGIYTVATTTNCKTNMNGSTTINITPQPTTQFSYTSNTFCKFGTSGPTTITGTPQTGTFSSTSAGLIFANIATGEIDLDQTPAGLYTIKYTIPAAGGCSIYTYTRDINIVNSPNYYRVTGGGGYCAGSVGVAVGLDGSQSGVIYKLFRGATLITTIVGTGSGLSFGNQTVAGTYTVYASLGSCSQQMDYEAIVTINPVPANIVITPASSTICLGNVVALTATGTPPSSTTGSVPKVSGNINLGIPDNNSNGTFSLLRVTGIPVGATITGVSIKFNIDHPYDGDLLINLKGPNDKVLNIANGIGGGGDDFNNTTVNSISVTNITSSVAPFNGTFAPQASIGVAGATAINNNSSNVSAFNGLYGATAASANGDWILSVRDKGNSDVGTFINWDINISYTVPGNTTAVVWTPATDLFTDPGATTAYTAGNNASTVYAKPATSGTKNFTAIATNGSGCSATSAATITVSPSPFISVTADYCTLSAQNKVVITATSNIPVTTNSWTWSGGYTSTNTTNNSKIEVNTAGTFYVSAIASGYSCPGTGQISVAQELVVNGDFEQGNTGFTSGYGYVSNTIRNGLYPAGKYTVSSNPNFSHDNFWGIDHTTADGNGKYMIINGTNDLIVWKQTVNVLPNTIYYFSAWAVNLNSDNNPANLKFQVKGLPIGQPTGSLPLKALNNSSGVWKRFYGTWNSQGYTGPVDIEIIDLQNAAGGNDFGLDDISFATLSSFFNLTSAVGTDDQTTTRSVCQGQPIVDIEYEVGGDGAAPVLSSGFALPDGVQTYWNGRNFRIFGTPTTSGTFNYEYKINVGSLCGPRTKTGTITVTPASKAGTFTTPIISTCYGANINLATNLTGTVGGLNWYSSPSGNPGTFSTASATITNLTSTAYYMAIAQNTNACIKDTSEVVIVGVKNLWVGNSNNWNDANNWSDKQLPTTGCDDVIIPQVSPKLSPVLSAGATPVIKNLKLLSGAKLEITNDAFIKIAGAITSDNGAITANEGNIELNAASDTQTISGSWFKNRNLKRLIVSSNVANSGIGNDTLNILFGLSFGNSTASLSTGNNITLRSTAAATASMGKLETGNSVTGEFNVERYIKYYQNWNLLSAPIRSVQSLRGSWQENGNNNAGYGTQITGVGPIAGTGLDAVSVSNSVKYYNAASGNYVMVGNTNTEMVNRKEGFFTFVRGNRSYGPGAAGSITTLRSKGTIYNATQKPIFNYTVPTNSFISIGNPYASAVDLMKLALPNAIETNFYFWDPLLYGSYGVGGYQTVAAVTGGVITPGSGLYDINKKYPNMQSGQAIFARTIAANPTITFTEDMKADSSLLVSRGGNQEDQISMLSTMIYSGNGDLADGNRVVFANNYSNAVDRFDAVKITNGGINFGLLRGSKKLIVEARQPVVIEDTLFYNMTNLRNGDHRLGFSVQNFENNLEATLIDNYLQTRTPVSLSDSSWYNFTADANAASKAANRFMLVFKAAAGPLPVTLTGISANRNSDRSIAIRWTVENEVNIEKYEIERSADGRNFTGIISADATNSNVYTKNDLSPLAADNFYRIKAITVGGFTQYSAIVKVAPIQEMASITVFPNPVVDGRTQVKFINQTKGSYELKLFNQGGQLMQQENVKVTGNSFVKTFVLNNNFAGGVYQLSITNPDGTKTTQQLIIK